jgi:hypothetical protein
MKKLRTTARALVAAVFFLAALNGCAPKDKRMDVTVAVDFGPAERPPLEKKVSLPERSTVFDALSRAFAVATSGR